MGNITAYSKEKMQEIADKTIQEADIVVGGGDTRELVLTHQDATTTNLGDIKGPDGDKGPIGGGLSLAQLQSSIDVLKPGPWKPLPVWTLYWETLGGAWQDPRYRLVGDIVELDGMVKYLDPYDVAPTSPGDLVNSFEGPMPEEMLPIGPANASSIMPTLRNGGTPTMLWAVAYTPTSGAIFVSQGGYTIPWVNGSWISLTGLSYPRTLP